MADNAPAPASESRFAIAKRKMAEPKMIALAAGLVVLAAIGVVAWRQAVIAPMKAIAMKRRGTHDVLIKLYDLQMTYRGKTGTFANDLESLLATAPDAQKIREAIKANADPNTLTVVGDADSFKLEANVLDPQRTIVRFRGPFPDKPREAPVLPDLPEPSRAP